MSIISDQGREFVNKINQSLFQLTNTKHKVTSAYHPQSNGLVERFNQTLQRTLLKQVNLGQNNWDVHLDGALFAYRTSVQKSTKFTPFEMMFCRYVLLLLYCQYQLAIKVKDNLSAKVTLNAPK